MAVAPPVFYHGGPPWQQHVYRDNNVLYHTILFCFPFGQKRREHIQEALVKETVLNDEVEGSEQRGCSLLEEMSVILPLFGLSYKEKERYPGDTSNIVYVFIITKPTSR